MAAGQPVPVTLLSGFLGAGKTTLLEHILKNQQGLRCAVIVNDVAQVNIDASLVKGTRLMQPGASMVELHNGCICCSLRDNLYVEIRKMAASGNFDVVVIESTGVSEPLQVAEMFFMDAPDNGPRLSTVARLDNCVTVVDASTFADNLRTVENVVERYGDAGHVKNMDALRDDDDDEDEDEDDDDAHAHCGRGGCGHDHGDDDDEDHHDCEPQEDDRNIAHLLVEQVEFANLVILNKTDLVTRELLDETVDLLRSLNASAHIECTQKSEVDLQWLLFTSKFSEKFALKAKGWMADLDAEKPAPMRSTAEYGIGSFVYRAALPFHPKRLHDFITEFFMLQELDGGAEIDDDDDDDDGAAAARSHVATVGPEVDRNDLQATLAQRGQKRLAALGNVLRSKGYLWIGTCSRLGSFGEWNHAGNILSLGYAGGWGMFPDPEGGIANMVGPLATSFVEKTPGQEIVFIGQSLKRAEISRLLDACLLTASEEAELAEAMHQLSAAGGGERRQAVLARKLGPFEDPFERWAEDDVLDEDDADGPQAAAAPDARWTAQRAAAAAASNGDSDDSDEDDSDDEDAGARRRPRGMK